MIGTSASVAEGNSLAAVASSHVGNIFLSGRSAGGVVATAAVVNQFRSLVSPETTGGIPLLVATDQEGGDVQVLNGPGFSPIPSALAQSQLAPGTLQADATTWGQQLAAAGVTMNLAPVADLVASPAAAANNPPIGGFDREYGFDRSTVISDTSAFSAGMTSAGIIPVLKHFPGLGAVTANTDTASGVTDSSTNSDSPSVGVFASAIDAGAPAVMISSAVYAAMDPALPAVFSAPITRMLLRVDLGFQGVILTDDLSAPAQVQQWSPAARAIMAITAGADLILVTAVPSLATQMIAAVVAEAQADPSFETLVNAAARHIVVLKEHAASVG